MSIINNSINAPIPFVSSQGGTGVVSPTAHGIMIAEGSSPMNPIVLGAGQVLIGTTSGDPVASVITGGSGISISSTSGSITISSTESVNWVSVSGTSQTMVAYTGYVTTNTGLTTVTLPSTSAFGANFELLALGSGGWKMVLGSAGQSVIFGTATTSATTGYVASTNVGDNIGLVCVNATTPGSEVFMVVHSIGNLTVV